MTTPYQWVVKFWMPLSLSHLSFSLSNVLSRSFSILSAMHYPNEMGIYCVTGTNIHISVQWSTIGRWHPWAVPLYSIQCLSRSKLPILMQINLAWKECVAPSLSSVTCFLPLVSILSFWLNVAVCRHNIRTMHRKPIAILSLPLCLSPESLFNLNFNSLSPSF